MGITCRVRLYELRILKAGDKAWVFFYGKTLFLFFSFSHFLLIVAVLWCEHQCAHVWMGVHMYEWRPRVSIRHLPWSLSTLVFEMRSLTEARTPGFVWAGWPASSQGSSAPAAPGLALRAYQHAWLLSRLWRAELRSSGLHGEHLPDWCSAPQ